MHSKKILTPHLFAANAARRGLAAATALGLVLGLATTASAVNYTTGQGKNAAFAAFTGNVLTTLQPQLTASIAKGKKKTVIAVEASYSDGPYTPTTSTMRVLGMRAEVNGVIMQPNPFAGYMYDTDCGWASGMVDTLACATKGTFWLDIDAAELANPGQFVGQPLTVTLHAGDLAGGGLVGVQLMDASLTVRVQKK